MRMVGKVTVLGLVLILLAGGCNFIDQLKARNHLNEGVSLYSAQKYDAAVEEFKRAIELDPELLDAKLYLATAYRAQYVPMVESPENLQKGQRAIASFEEVLKEDPDNETALLQIADLHRNMGRPEESKETYRRLMEVSQNDASAVSNALYGIAVINYNLADKNTGNEGENVENLEEEEIARTDELLNEGIEALRQALEVRPDYSDAKEYLSLLYREKSEIAQDREEKRKWDREALELAREALELRKKEQREEERKRRQVFDTENESN